MHKFDGRTEICRLINENEGAGPSYFLPIILRSQNVINGAANKVSLSKG